MILNKLNSCLSICLRYQTINPQLVFKIFHRSKCTSSSTAFQFEFHFQPVSDSECEFDSNSLQSRKPNPMLAFKLIQNQKLSNPASLVKYGAADQLLFNNSGKVLVSQRSNYSSASVSHNQTGSSDSNTPQNENTEKSKRWSNWTGKNSWKGGLLFMALTFAATGGAVIYTWGEPQRDEHGEIIMDSYSDKPAVIAYTLRAWNDMKDFFQMVRAPTSDKLLPDPLVPPYVQPPYTLVLELSGLLLKPEWDLKMGWRFKKRPGLDYLLQVCTQSGYEIVIFSLEPANVAFPLTVSMDPQNFIWYRLFKEDTRYTSGVHIKDLNCLNRDLSKVILIDVKKEPYQLHPRNGIAVNAWNGDAADRELYDLAAFLQTVATNKVEDIRSVIQHYNQYDDPMAKFRENQAAVLKSHEEMLRMQAEETKKPQVPKSPFISSNIHRR